MYPISFENPNSRSRPQRAANRNIADATPQGEKAADFAEEDRLLVVECRTDDRWRVVLCTGLEDLDDALDTVRSLRRAEGTDEVSLTIEVSGHQGRESRREVVRFDKETAGETQTATVSGLPRAEMQAMEAAFAAVSPAFKMPDISYEDMILPKNPAQDLEQDPASPVAVNDSAEPVQTDDASVVPPTAVDEVALSGLAWEDDVIQAHHVTPSRQGRSQVKNASNDIPEFLKVSAAPHTDAAAGDMSLGMDAMIDQAVAHGDGVPDGMEDEIEIETPDLVQPMDSDPFSTDTPDARQRIPQSFASNSQVSWIDDLLNKNSPAHGPAKRSSRPVGYDAEDDDDDFATRLESPMFARENGVTAKVLVFAGTVALLILGGALAELLAVDITSSANAQVHFLDEVLTLTTPSGQ